MSDVIVLIPYPLTWERPFYRLVAAGIPNRAAHHYDHGRQQSVRTLLTMLGPRRNVSLYVYPSAVVQAIVQKGGHLPPMRRAPPITGPFLVAHSRDPADIVSLLLVSFLGLVPFHIIWLTE